MASLYAQYLMERTNDLIVELPYGFAAYRYLDDDKTVYIIDIYVQPEFRKLGKAAEIADAVVLEARNRGCYNLVGSVVPSAKNSTISMKVLLAYGMILDSSANDFIIFKKDI